RYDAGDRRAPQKSGRGSDARGSKERVRTRAEAAVQNDARVRRVHGLADLSGMDDFAAVEQVLGQLGNRHREGARDSRRGPLRSAEGEGAHPRLPGGEEASAGNEGTDSLLRGPSGRGQDVAWQVHRAFSGAQV